MGLKGIGPWAFLGTIRALSRDPISLDKRYRRSAQDLASTAEVNFGTAHDPSLARTSASGARRIRSSRGTSGLTGGGASGFAAPVMPHPAVDAASRDVPNAAGPPQQTELSQDSLRASASAAANASASNRRRSTAFKNARRAASARAPRSVAPAFRRFERAMPRE